MPSSAQSPILWTHHQAELISDIYTLLERRKGASSPSPSISSTTTASSASSCYSPTQSVAGGSLSPASSPATSPRNSSHDESLRGGKEQCGSNTTLADQMVTRSNSARELTREFQGALQRHRNNRRRGSMHADLGIQAPSAVAADQERGVAATAAATDEPQLLPATRFEKGRKERRFSEMTSMEVPIMLEPEPAMEQSSTRNQQHRPRPMYRDPAGSSKGRKGGSSRGRRLGEHIHRV